MRRLRVRGALCVCGWLAGCAPRPPGAVDLVQLLEAREESRHADIASVAPILQLLREDPCAAADAARDAGADATGQRATALAEFAEVAELLCFAGVESAEGTTDGFGNPILAQPDNGVLVGGDTYFVLSSDAETLLTRVHVDDRSESVCEGQGDYIADAVIHPVGVATVTLRTDPVVPLMAIDDYGQTVCMDMERGTMTLPGAGAPWTLYFGAMERGPDTAALYTSAAAPSVAGFVWIAGQVQRFDFQVGPYTESAASLSSSCVGWISSEPTTRFAVLQDDYGYIEVSSGGDTVMAVRGPDGQVWCNDDSVGLNPALDLWLARGEYDLWIGTYSEGVELTASVTFY